MTYNHIPSGSKNYIFHTLLDYCMQEMLYEGKSLQHLKMQNSSIVEQCSKLVIADRNSGNC